MARWSWSSIKRAVLCRSLSMYLRSDETPTPVWYGIFTRPCSWLFSNGTVRALPVKSFFVSVY